MKIQISWLLQKPTDLDLHRLQRQGISGFSRTRVQRYCPYLLLLKLSFCLQACRLDVTYRLPNLKEDTFEVRPEKCVISPPIFYFHKDHLSSPSAMNQEIARHFGGKDTNCYALLRYEIRFNSGPAELRYPLPLQTV